MLYLDARYVVLTYHFLPTLRQDQVYVIPCKFRQRSVSRHSSPWTSSKT
ncbi:hypothetical protein LSH36_324g02015 [Paralvinella palmiformis]|uniref:Uncharacterized protein n=1 Tax=Paralvinella palmiformis TaxID=53620 RepID=A0AAD9JI71_9ANNE|nr:hypothetical protein LSH36_324g02015 [Paralvinella palmiformis]